MKQIFTLIILLLTAGYSLAQVTVNGLALPVGGGRPASCAGGSMKLKGVAAAAGSCIDMTQNTFENSAVWVCDPIDLNQNFRIDFELNFDGINSGDGIAFVLQEEGVSDVLGGAGGGLGYSFGNKLGCLGGDCIVGPSISVEFDIWDNSVDLWDFANPGLGTINDISCDHISMHVDGDQRVSGTIAGPSCMAATDVTDGVNHTACIIWDPAASEFTVSFDGAVITSFAGDIRTFFSSPSAVNWGFTAGSGGANVNLQICNVVMNTNIAGTPPPCNLVLSNKLLDFKAVCTGDKQYLNWNLASGHELDQIRVERSNNGIDFVEISELATTLSTLEYSIVDLQEPDQRESYYRLKLIGKDGGIDYSDVINSSCNQNLEEGLNLYPNPVSNELNISTTIETVSSVEIYAADGRLLETVMNFSTKNKQAVSFDHFSKGLYIILIQLENGSTKAFKVTKI